MGICLGRRDILGEGTVDLWFPSRVIEVIVLFDVAGLRMVLMDDFGELLGCQLRRVSILRTGDFGLAFSVLYDTTSKQSSYTVT